MTKDHNDLDKDEVNIISGVLEMRKKTVGDIMTPIEDAYMLPIDSILDFETISKIMNSGEEIFQISELTCLTFHVSRSQDIRAFLYTKAIGRTSCRCCTSKTWHSSTPMTTRRSACFASFTRILATLSSMI